LWNTSAAILFLGKEGFSLIVIQRERAPECERVQTAQTSVSQDVAAVALLNFVVIATFQQIPQVFNIEVEDKC
jgi:hypothetical protein